MHQAQTHLAAAWGTHSWSFPTAAFCRDCRKAPIPPSPSHRTQGGRKLQPFAEKKLIENKTKKTPPQHKNKPKNLLFSSSQLKSLFTRAQDTLMSCPWSLLIPAWKWLCLGTQVTSTKPLCWLHWQSSGNTIDLISSSKAPMEQAQQIPECPRII